MEGGPPGFRQDSSCPAVLRYVLRGARISRTGPSPSLAGLPRPFRCPRTFLHAIGRPTTPCMSPRTVWAPPRSLAATGGISFDFYSCWYLDGSLPSVFLPSLILLGDGWKSSRLPGYPIRRSGDRRILAPPPGFSQLVTSFFAWQLLGILRGPYFRLTILSFSSYANHFQKTSWRHGDSNPRPSACKADALAS